MAVFRRVWRGGGWCRFGVLALVLALSFPAAAAIWHVKSDGDDGRDGQSWAQALASVQVALSRAAVGDAVWIAGGEYEATESRLLEPDAEWEWSFRLRDGVDIYGGFAGHERSPAERALAAAHDGIPPCAWDYASATRLTIPDHAFGSVLKADADAFTLRTVVDGVVLCGGMAFSSGLAGVGGGAQLPGNVVLRRSVVTGCMARYGGGVAMRGDSVLEQCLICDNELLPDGWGAAGAGVYVIDDEGRVSNCLIRDNGVADRGVQEGGGIYLLGAGTVNHCTIVGNYALHDGSGVCAPVAAARLLNLVVWGNCGNDKQLVAPASDLSYSAIAGVNAPGQAVIPLAAGNCGVNGPEVNDNENDHYFICFRDLARNDYRLGAGSYAINRGVDALLAAHDAAGAARLSRLVPDPGAFETAYRGQLCGDFQVETPCVYGWESLVTPRPGVCTPAMAETTFQAQADRLRWRQDAEARHYAQWLQAGPVLLEMGLAVTGAQADAWETATRRRQLVVQPQTVYIAANDVDYYYGTAMPELGWELLAGRLAGEDRVVGALACTPGTMLERGYPITQGSLAIADGRDGANYHIEFFPGQLNYRKAVATLRLAAGSCVYNGEATAPELVNDPPGLNIDIVYAGRDGTVYSASTAAPRDVGSYTLTATVRDEHYCGSLQEPFAITPAPLTVTAANQERPFGSANPALTMSFSGFCARDSVADIVQPILTTAAGPDSPVCAGGYAITVSGGAARNYAFVYVPGVLTVTPAELVDSDVVSQAITYGAKLATAPLSGRVCAVTSGAIVPGRFVWNGGDTILPVGTHNRSWVFHADDSGNYRALSGASTLRVDCRPVAVKALSRSKIYGEADPSLTYSIVSGALVPGDSFSGALARQPGENVGVYAINQGSLALSANYALSYQSANLRITVRQITVSAQDSGKAFGTADPVLPYAVTSTTGLVAGDRFHGALSRAPGEDIGVYAISQGSLALSANYAMVFNAARFTINEAGLELAAPLALGGIVYGQTLRRATIVGEVRHFATGERVPGVFSWVQEDVAPPAGTRDYEWLFEPEAADSYAPLHGSATLAIAPAPLTVRLQTPAPERSYGVANPPLGLAYSGFVLGEDQAVLVRVPTAQCAATVASPAGVYPVTISGGLSSNYTFVYETDVLTVAPALPRAQDIAAAADAVYGMALADLGLTGSFAHPTEDVAVPGRLVWELPGAMVLPAGEHWLSWVFTPESSNYSELRGEQPVTIAKAALQVSADDQSRWYGDANPDLTLTYAGLVNGDTLATPGLFTTAPQAQCVADATTLAGAYPITVAGGLAENYHFVYELGTLTVRAIEPVVDSFTPPVFFYGENVASKAPTAVVRHPGSGEEMGGYFVICGEEDFPAVGVWPRGWRFIPSLPGSVAELEVSAALVIQPRILRIQPANVSKIYGEAEPALSWSLAAGSMSLYNGDRVSGALVREPGEQPGEYAIQLGTLTAGSNYSLELLPAVMSISQRSLTLQCLAATKVYGDPDPVFQYHLVAGSLLAGDTPVGQLGRLAGEDVGSYAMTQGSLTFPDYYRVTLQSAPLMIVPRALTVTAMPASKVYGNADPVFAWTLSAGALQAGDELSVVLGRQPGENIGAYAIIPSLLTGGPNYVLSFVSANLVIERRHVGVIAHDQAKLVSTPDPEFTYELAPGSELPSGARFSGALTWSGYNIPGYHDILIGTLTLGNNCIIDYTPGRLRIAYPNPVLAEAVTASVISYGDPLSMSLLSGRFLHPLTGETLPGTLSWDNPDRRYLAGSYSTRFIFTPDPASGISTIYQGTVIVQVLRRRLKIVGDRIEKAHAAALPPLTWHIAEGTLYSGDALTGKLVCSLLDNVGEYPILQGSLAAPASYEMEYVSGVLVVTPRVLHLQAYDNSKIAGGYEPTLSYFLASGYYLVGAKPTGQVARDPGEAPGTYAIRQGSLTPPANHIIEFINGTFTIYPATRGGDDYAAGNGGMAATDAVESWDSDGLKGLDAVTAEATASYAVVSPDFAGAGTSGAELPALGSLCCATLEEAIAGVAAGGVIHVMPGLYLAPGDGNWLVDKPLTLCGMSANGPDDVVLHGSVVVAGPAARGVQLAGLTVLSRQERPAVVLTAGVSQVALTENTLVGGDCAIGADLPSYLYLVGNQLSGTAAVQSGDSPDAHIVDCDNVFVEKPAAGCDAALGDD